MNPFEIYNNNEIKDEFFHLARSIFTFVPNWDDPRIGHNMVGIFSRTMNVQAAIEEYHEKLKERLTREGTDFRIATAVDTQRQMGSHAEFSPASEQAIKTLNKQLKEPHELVIAQCIQLKITQNDSNLQYAQSNICLPLELPSQVDIDNHLPFKVFVAPPGTTSIPYGPENVPSREQLIREGYKEVVVGYSNNNELVHVRGGKQAQRHQYTLRHVGACTINSSQGQTIYSGITGEITAQCCPWLKSQLIVLMSRARTAAETILVGDPNFAIPKMWELITCGNQWTQFCQHVIDAITVGDGPVDCNTNRQNIFSYPQVFPYEIRSIPIPCDISGFVYFLVSSRDGITVYVGETENLSQRMQAHNNGNGSLGTEDIRLRPWELKGYICGLSAFTDVDRKSLESDWVRRIEARKLEGISDPLTFMNQGMNIVNDYNRNNDDQIRFVCVSDA